MMSAKEIEEYFMARITEKLNERVIEHWDDIAGNQNLPVVVRANLNRIYQLAYMEAIIDVSKIIEYICKVNGGN